MKKLIIVLCFIGFLIGGITYYNKISKQSPLQETEVTKPYDLVTRTERLKDKKFGNRISFFKERSLLKTINRIQQNPYSYNSMYSLLDYEVPRERTIEEAKKFITDEDLDRSRQAIDVLLRLQTGEDFHVIINDLIKLHKDNQDYIRGLLHLHDQYRAGDTDGIVKYIINNELYITSDDFAMIVSKASPELQLEYLNSGMLNSFKSLGKRNMSMKLGIPDNTGRKYSDLLFRKQQSDSDLLNGADRFYMINKLYSETVSNERIERILHLLETTNSSNAKVGRFIADYATSEPESQARLEKILLRNRNNYVPEHVLVNLIILFPESQIAKDYLVNELNEVTDITSPQHNTRQKTLLD